MSQHFLLSAAARTLSLSRIMRMTDDEARDTFKRIRWAATGGEPFCPHCGCLTAYTLAETPPRWKCSACRRKFSLTSGTLFHSRKLPVRDYLAIIALFVNGVKGTSALQMSRDLNVNEAVSFCCTNCVRQWDRRFTILTSPSCRARYRSTEPISADTSNRKTERPIAKTADSLRNTPASARSSAVTGIIAELPPN
jgi:hypothetical protein